MVCKQVQETVHHIFNSWFWSAPVIRNRQKGTLQRAKQNRGDKGENSKSKSLRWIFACHNFQCVDQCILTLGPASCDCHRKEGRRGDVHHEAAIHEDIWTTDSRKVKRWRKDRRKTTTTNKRSVKDRLHHVPHLLFHSERSAIFWSKSFLFKLPDKVSRQNERVHQVYLKNTSLTLACPVPLLCISARTWYIHHGWLWLTRYHLETGPLHSLAGRVHMKQHTQSVLQGIFVTNPKS